MRMVRFSMEILGVALLQVAMLLVAGIVCDWAIAPRRPVARNPQLLAIIRQQIRQQAPREMDSPMPYSGRPSLAAIQSKQPPSYQGVALPRLEGFGLTNGGVERR
jgi:hypothetical protein